MKTNNNNLTAKAEQDRLVKEIMPLIEDRFGDPDGGEDYYSLTGEPEPDENDDDDFQDLS